MLLLPFETDGSDSCDWWEIQCRMKEFGQTIVGNAVENLAAAVLEGVGTIVGVLASQWVFVGNFDLTSSNGSAGGIASGNPVAYGQHPSSASNVETLLGYATWISLGICVLALIFLGATMALHQRRGEGSHFVSKIGIVLFATVLISAASGIVTGVLPSTGPDASRPVAFLQSRLWWYMGAAAVMSVIVGAVRMVWEQRAEPGKELLKSLMTLVVVSGAGLTGISAAVAAADGFAKWIIFESTDAEFGEAITKMLVVSQLNATGAFLAIFLGIFVIFFSLLQIILMVIRTGMIVILAGIFPLAASFTNTEMGKQWFRKCLGWLIAFILYKPAAAIIYATAFQLIGTSSFYDDDPTGILPLVVGLTMMIISLIALPALMKFVAPMASLGGGSVAGTMAGVAGLAGGVASGAVRTGLEQANTATSEGGGASTRSPQGSVETPGRQVTNDEPTPQGGPGTGTSPEAQTASQQGMANAGTQASTATTATSTAAGAATGGVAILAQKGQEIVTATGSDVMNTLDDALKDPDGS